MLGANKGLLLLTNTLWLKFREQLANMFNFHKNNSFPFFPTNRTQLILNLTEICSNLQGLANGNINRPNMKPLSGDKVTFSCNPHYDLVGNKAIFCDRGTWNGTVPQCVGKNIEQAP